MKTRNKLGYGVGDLGAGTLWAMVSSFILIYLTDSVGMNAAVVGTMLLIARSLDGVTDAFMGTLIDNTHSKIGKARPWFFASILPLVVSTVLLFNVPANISEASQKVYVFIMYVAMTAIFYTANNVSYNALPAFVTDSTKDRIGMNVFRYLFTLSGGIAIGSITIPLVTSLGGSPNSQVGWTQVSIIYGLVAAAALTIAGFSVKEKVSEAKAKPGKEKKDKNKLPFYKAFWYTFNNKYFLIMLAIALLGLIRMGTLAAGVYYAQYNLGNPALYGLMTVASLLPMMVGLVLSPALAAKIGMQKSMIVGAAVSLFGAIVAALFGDNFILLLIGMGLAFFGMGPGAASTAALLAHVADYGEWKHGEKLAGTTFSCNSVATKVGTGIGNALVGWGLALGAYNAGAVVQPDSALFAIKALYLYVPVIVCLITLALVFFLDIEKRIPGIKKELAARSEVE